MKTPGGTRTLGWALSLTGLALLLLSETNTIGWFLLTFIGAVLINGVPSKRALMRIVHIQPAVAVIAAALVLTGYKLFGAEFILRSVIVSIMSLYVFTNIVIVAATRLIKNGGH